MKKLYALVAMTMLAAPAGMHAQKGPPRVCNDVQTTAVALKSPIAWAFVDNQCFDLSIYIKVNAGGKTWTMDTGNLDILGNTLRVSANFNSDPFITFGATTTNITGPTTYAFLFGTPVVPGFYDIATSTGGVSVTNGARGTSDVSATGIYPSYISGYGSVAFVPTNLGVDLGTTACTASGVPFTVTTTCAQGTASNSFAPTFYDGLEALLTYTQTDIASVASWSGAVTLNTTVVPEPASFVLMAAGLVMFGGLAARRRNQ